MKKYITIILLLVFCLPGLVYAEQGRIAYLAHTDGFWQLWVMSPDGKDQRQVTSSEYDKTHISWYPDHLHMLVNGSQGHLSKVNVNTQLEEPVSLPLKDALDAVISPDGKHIVFSLSVMDSKDNNHLWLVDSSGENLKKITNMGGLQHEPVWSPDGQWIYFLSGDGKSEHNIWRVSIDNNKTEQLTAGALFNFDIALSAKGLLAFSSNRNGNYDLWSQSINGAPSQITNDEAIDSRPSWSPDGNEIVFESSRGGVMNIWRLFLNKSDNKPVQITHEAIGARYPVWSNN